MNNIIDWNIIEKVSVNEQLKDYLKKQKELDILKIQKDNDEDFLNNIEELFQEYKLYSQKLEFMSKLNDNEQAMKMILKIDCLNSVKEKQKMKMILSYGVLVDYFKKINERTDEEIFMLSACSSVLDLEDYAYYIGILSDESIASSIINKTEDINEQVCIAFRIMDSQDELLYDFIDEDNYEELLDNANNTINNYRINHSK